MSPDDTTLQAVKAIREVKYAKSETTGKYYLLIMFKDPAWIEYLRLDLYFRIITGNNRELGMHKFTEVPTSIENNALLVLLNGELQGVYPKKIRIFSAPPPQDVWIKEFQILVQDKT